VRLPQLKGIRPLFISIRQTIKGDGYNIRRLAEDAGITLRSGVYKVTL